MAPVGCSLLCPHARHEYRQCQPEQPVDKLINLLWVNTFRGQEGTKQACCRQAGQLSTTVLKAGRLPVASCSHGSHVSLSAV